MSTILNRILKKKIVQWAQVIDQLPREHGHWIRDENSVKVGGNGISLTYLPQPKLCSYSRLEISIGSANNNVVTIGAKFFDPILSARGLRHVIETITSWHLIKEVRDETFASWSIHQHGLSISLLLIQTLGRADILFDLLDEFDTRLAKNIDEMTGSELS